MVPQNGPQQRSQQFPNFMSQGSAGGVDPLSFSDAPHVAKQMAALNAMNQARISQNSRPTPSPLSASGGTSSGSYLGSITNSHNFPSNSHDILNVSAGSNGHANFPMSNNFGLSQNPSSASNGSLLDPTAMSQGNMARPQAMKDQQLKARETSFLQGLANFFAKNGSPLPPALTGMNFPNYDASASPWSVIDPGNEVGHFKIAGKDVGIFRLWATVMQAGGSTQIENSKGWPSVLAALGLPAEMIDPLTNNQISVLKNLRDVYGLVLSPFEAMYRRNLQEQQKKVQMSQGQPVNLNPQPGMRAMSSNGLISGSIPSSNGQVSFPPSTSQQRPPLSSSDSHTSLGAAELDPFTPSETNLLDQDVQGIKRKHDSEGPDTKRARQKTDPPEGNPVLSDVANNSQAGSQPTAASGTANRPRQQPARRKIEYVPWAREMETFGGWDVDTLDADWHTQQIRRPIREISEWGLVDTEHLCMSLRSRLAVELSYALTTFTVLSTMREQQPGTGLALSNCPDLLEDVLDLLEETAFSGPEASQEDPLPTAAHNIITNRELLTMVQDAETRPFAALDVHQGSKDPSLGPFPRPGNIIIAIVAIIRNLAGWSNNWDFLAGSPRVTDMLLRLCVVDRDENNNPRPASRCLSMGDLLLLRREIMIIFLTISGPIKLSNTPSSQRIARRLFELIASYLVDSLDALPPLASVQLAGVAPNAGLRPPLLAETALEVLTRFAQSDHNRQFLTKIIPPPWIHQLLNGLIHRVPMVESDFLLMQREYWASYVEKVIMGIYSLLFIAPYSLKQRIKADRRLGVKSVLLRMAQRVLMVPNDGRAMFVIPARRSVEALKLLDKGEEKVDTAEPALPALQFGMGFSDGSDSSFEKGTGLLSANRDVAWDMLLMRDVLADEVFFNELDSLVRVEYS